MTRFMKIDPNHTCNLAYFLVYLEIFLYVGIVFLCNFKNLSYEFHTVL